MKAVRCQICRKPLSDPESIAQGYGPECAGRMATATAAISGSVQAMGLTEADIADPEVSRWLDVALKAKLAGKELDYDCFIDAARRTAQRYRQVAA